MSHFIQFKEFSDLQQKQFIKSSILEILKEKLGIDVKQPVTEFLKSEDLVRNIDTEAVEQYKEIFGYI